MPRKSFEETSYDPIAADLARDVAAAGRGRSALPFVVPKPSPQSFEAPTTRKTEDVAFPPRSQPRQAEPCITKRFVLTRKEDDDLNAFLLRLQAQAGTRVTLSVVVRAALSALMHAEEQILTEIGDRFSKRYPSTQDSVGQGEFEERWTRCLTSALKKIARTPQT